jgi:hypothetical protein
MPPVHVVRQQDRDAVKEQQRLHPSALGGSPVRGRVVISDISAGSHGDDFTTRPPLPSRPSSASKLRPSDACHGVSTDVTYAHKVRADQDFAKWAWSWVRADSVVSAVVSWQPTSPTISHLGCVMSLQGKSAAHADCPLTPARSTLGRHADSVLTVVILEGLVARSIAISKVALAYAFIFVGPAGLEPATNGL